VLKTDIEDYKIAAEVSPFSIFCIMVYGCFIDHVDSKKLVINFTIFTGIVYLIVAVSGLFNFTKNEVGRYSFQQILELAKGLAVIS